MTRVVLEVTQPITFSQADAGDPRHLDITVPELDWRADTASSLGHGVGLVHRVAFAIPDTGNGRLNIETTRPAILQKMFLIAPQGPGNYRRDVSGSAHATHDDLRVAAFAHGYRLHGHPK